MKLFGLLNRQRCRFASIIGFCIISILLIDHVKEKQLGVKDNRLRQFGTYNSFPVLVSTKDLPENIAYCADPLLLNRSSISLRSEDISSNLKYGGYFHPSSCTPKEGPSLIIIPHDANNGQFSTFLNGLHSLLQAKMLEYVIYVVERTGNDTQSNTATLLNIGYLEAQRFLHGNRTFQCVIFHDTFLAPPNNDAMYSCRNFTMITDINDFYGVTAVPSKTFEQFNGFSTNFNTLVESQRNLLKRMIKSGFQVTNQSQTNIVRKPTGASLSNFIEDEGHTGGLKSISYVTTNVRNFLTHTLLRVENITTVERSPMVGFRKCPEKPANLVGWLAVNFEQPSFSEIAATNPDLMPGGYYHPPHCLPNQGPTAFIIPYRNREVQLRTFLHQIHPILQRQLLEYVIIVVEQAGQERFNRALLMNIGYRESLKILPNHRQFQCYIFHDVDLIPEDDRTIFTCKDSPIHLSGYINKFNYILPYANIFGGASAIPRQQFELVNGYSNVYFGWGGEDDDMASRLAHVKLKITRPEKNLLRYKMFKHDAEPSNKENGDRWRLLKNPSKRMNFDGLNSLHYTLLRTELMSTHTHIVVEFSESEINQAVFGSSKIKL